jgi:aminoglycoside phosphotransferase (APT) family kinase protein
VQRAAGRFCAAGDAAPRHARHCARAAFGVHSGIPALFDPKLELFAWFVPDDPKLTALGRLCDAVHAPSLAMGGATGRVDAELIRYVPESRACARFELGRPDAIGSRCMFVKVDRARGGGATHALMRALRDSPAQSEGRLVTPRSLLWQPAVGLHWQEGVDGEPLADLYPNECPPEVSARVGRLIAALHATAAPLARQIDAAQLPRQQRDYANLLAKVEPAWEPQLSQLLVELAEGVDEIRALPLATLHGDLHLRNILADGDRLALIDLDSCMGGAVVLELGAWIACAIDRALALGSALESVQVAAAMLLRAYRECSDQPVSAQHVAWGVAHALLCVRAYRAVANLHRGSYSHVPALLALACFILRYGVEDHPLPIQ